MASRQEEKERRRQERIAAEEAAAASAARRRRLQLATGGILAIALVAAIVIAIAAGGSKSSKPKAGGGGTSAKLPAVKITDLAKAAKAAGCTVQDFPGSTEDRAHVSGSVKYKTNPPAFGPHNPTPSSDGDYVGQGTPAKENLVHALEHGRIEIQYRPGLPQAQISQLEALFNESTGSFGSGQFLLLFQNKTAMPYDVAAVAWTHILGCKTFNPRVFDAIRAFRLKWTLQAPEKGFTQAE
ncbi:MAG: hypothetical protein QOK31_814 [Solirubrobacteraceae bacterium]|jgi:hypothetical protein|nr:hypothetical protein [Solirubrobacteraceae bacterium]